MVSKRGRIYRDDVYLAIVVRRPHMLIGPLELEIDMHPPDGKRRDVDNILKATLDALKFAKVYEDDSQVKKLTVERLGVVKGGKLVIRIREV